MRFACVGLVGALVAVGWNPGARAEPNEPAATKAEIDRLERELRQDQISQAYFAAVKAARQLYLLQRRATGDESPEAERRKTTLAHALNAAGDYGEALQLFQEISRGVEKEKGPDSHEALYALSPIAGIYWAQNRFEELDPIQRRMLEIARRRDGERSLPYAQQLLTYGTMMNFRNQYAAAQQAYEQSLQIQEALAKTPDDLSLLGPLQILASLYWQTNRPDKAIAIYDRTIAISEHAQNSNVMVRAGTLWGIAAIYHSGARDDLAAPLLARVIALYEKEVARLDRERPDDPQLPAMLGQLGNTYRQAGNLANAERTLARALTAGQKRNGFSGWEYPLAEIKRARGKPKEALALLESAKATSMRLMPGNTTTYNTLIADVLRDLGEYARAEKLIDERLAEVGQHYGPSHPLYGLALLSASKNYAAAGKIPQAERALTACLELAEKDLRLVLRTGTESDHAVYFARNNYQLDTAINFQLNFAPKSPSAARLALTTLLRRKGRVLDAAAAAMGTIRSKLSPEDQKLLDQLGSTRAQLAKLTVAGPAATGGDDYTKEIAALEDRLQRLEQAVSQKSAAYRVVSEPIELRAVQKMIPPDARLVELVNFQPYDARAPYAIAPVLPPRRYAAYVVGGSGDPTLVDLGDAAAIERAVESFRQAVSDPDNDRAVDLGHDLYRLTMAKIAPKLGGATNLLIAPDGALNLVPFAALVDDKRQFLIRRYTFTYPTSGRDLLRLKVQTKSRGGGLIFADPSFDATTPETTPTPTPPSGPDATTRGRRSVDLATLTWQPLPGTSREADEVGKTMPGLRVLRREQATEGAIKAVRGPKILHLATHGFFLPDEAPTPSAEPTAGAALPTPTAPTRQENPLLRSGLALAGANQLRSGKEDGILTAMEASGLDLWGTQLVVLSACETGVGKVTNGEGVYGLRRAIVMAGAESLVMSLWQVDDLATKDLMAGYYAKLAAGKGRSSALRDTQLEIAAQSKYAHPYFWASFLAAGANSPLDKDRP